MAKKRMIALAEYNDIFAKDNINSLDICELTGKTPKALNKAIKRAGCDYSPSKYSDKLGREYVSYNIRRKDAVNLIKRMNNDFGISVKNIVDEHTTKKKCNVCGEKVSLDDFYKKRNSLQEKCKKCQGQERKNYSQTKDGLISILYDSQVKRSLKNDLYRPPHTKKEFKEWCMDQKKFHKLYSKWADSNYSHEKVPSVDRINPDFPYVFGNMQFMTWIENKEKGYSEKRSNKKDIAIDGDYLIFMCTEGKNVKMNMFGSEEGDIEGSEYKEPLKPYKDKFKALVRDVEDEVAANMPGELSNRTVVLLSDSSGNFRYDIYPDYKGERPPRSKLFYRLRSWAEKTYGYVDHTEADDLCSFYSGRGDVVCSMDKDIINGTSGTFFNVHHMHRTLITTSDNQARNFNLIQTLMGDRVDNIPGLPRVGEKTAIKLLEEFGWNWEGVVKAYLSKGLTEEDAILTRRLVCMRQWTPKKGVELWKP